MLSPGTQVGHPVPSQLSLAQETETERARNTGDNLISNWAAGERGETNLLSRKWRMEKGSSLLEIKVIWLACVAASKLARVCIPRAGLPALSSGHLRLSESSPNKRLQISLKRERSCSRKMQKEKMAKEGSFEREKPKVGREKWGKKWEKNVRNNEDCSFGSLLWCAVEIFYQHHAQTSMCRYKDQSEQSLKRFLMAPLNSTGPRSLTGATWKPLGQPLAQWP